MLIDKPLTLGILKGTIYDFPLVGDTLAMHTHGPADVHITIVARGSVRMHGNGWEKIGKAGNVVDWEPDMAHEFVALEPNTRVVNIVKGVEP